METTLLILFIAHIKEVNVYSLDSWAASCVSTIIWIVKNNKQCVL